MTLPIAASVLVVDDNPNKLLALETVLAPLGVRTVCAESGRAALRHLLHEDFAVILLDVRMADLDGFDTAALIRQRRRSEHTPIIFVTAFGEAEADMARGYALGAVDFVFSPIAPEVLRNKVAVFVDLHHKSEEIRRQTEQLRRLEALEHRRRLERAESGRRRAEARFATILDIAGDAILAVDDEQRVILFNEAAERTFGRAAEDTIGVTLDRLIVEDVSALLRVADEGEPGTRREVHGRRADGGEFPAEVSVARTADGERSIWSVILRDVTERKQAEQQVRRLNTALNERLRVGVEMVTDLAASLDPVEVLGRLLRRAAATVSAEWGTLLQIDARRMVVQDSRDLHQSRGFEQVSRVEGEPLLVQAIAEQRLVVAAPFSAEMLPAAARAWGGEARSVAVLPLAAGETVAAVLLLGHREPIGFGEDAVETLRLIGNVAVVALRNAQLFSQAEGSSRSKSEFLNLAAHELRTPLTVVRGYASMLADGSLGAPPGTFARPLEVLTMKLDELTALVDDLLTAARAEEGRLIAQPQQFDLRLAVVAAADRARPRVDLGGGAIEVEAGHKPVMVDADPEHVARILDNIVNNALTYTDGAPWVRLEVAAVAPEAEVRIADRGPGVPDEMHEQIFERFVRFDHPALGPLPGTGLGLYISRELADEQGGSLRLERSNGDGSCFVLALPLAAESTTTLSGERAPAGGTSRRQRASAARPA